jgi:hypothetical protein
MHTDLISRLQNARTGIHIADAIGTDEALLPAINELLDAAKEAEIALATPHPKPAGSGEAVAHALPDDNTRAAVWPKRAQYLAFEWLRALALSDGAPEHAGVALDTWHNAAMDLRDMKNGFLPRWVARAAFNSFDKDGFKDFVRESNKAGLDVRYPIFANSCPAADAELREDARGVRVPMDVISTMAEIEVIDVDDPRGGGYTKCPACGESAQGHWDGPRGFVRPKVGHLDSCPAEFARRLAGDVGA